jgi:hypothetical protein
MGELTKMIGRTKLLVQGSNPAIEINETINLQSENLTEWF